MGDSLNQRRELPVLPWRTRITLLFLNFMTNVSLRSDGTVNRLPFRLLQWLNFMEAAESKPCNGVSSSDVTVDPSRNLWFRVFIPSPSESGPDRYPVIIFFHGGGFVFLSPDFKSYDLACRRLARRIGAVVVSVNYRLAPEHTYPAQYDDGFDVLKFLDDNRNAGILPENADLSRCFLAGDSAGGNLAHHVAKRSSVSEFSRIKIIGVVAIQPFFGGEERTESESSLAEVDQIASAKRTDWMWKAFMAAGMDRDDEVINVSGPRAADISKLDFPATMVVVAGFDSIRVWQIRYYEWLTKSGKEAYLVDFPDMIHAFYIFPELPQSGQLISQIKLFIQNQCSKHVP